MADPTTAERLSAYYAAELRTLQALRVEQGDTRRLNNELKEIRDGIKELRSQMGAEVATATGAGPRVLRADFSQRGCR